ncbi:myo-inosose-2 dehydratase [Actinomadura sp. ATCC 31491]|uniref:Myo-inosose-2 dehydratase n=1 Tax=Actinomadura luzonensis TaxID=2805427 RepID=A0ABT0G1K2_9ACTN|nr:myo-inosose-2 dehydratase [Actinomadura luzonensis]MCK2218499.1 myo-inosose-2 dehydratase [Actinomadura luzonensis]
MTAAQDKRVRVAASPINWRNDDFPVLGADTAVDTILGDMRRAGFDGTELGSVFPSDPAQLAAVLRRHDLALAAGWFSAFLLQHEPRQEYERFERHCAFLAKAGAGHVTTAECSWCPFKQPGDDPYTQHWPAVGRPLFPRSVPALTDQQWDRLADGLIELIAIAERHELTLGYHPHIQTVVENTADLDKLAERVSRRSDGARHLPITLDTGHLALAGDNPLDTLTKYVKQVTHLHLKNIRPAVAERLRKDGTGFEFAVIEGVFTVPGDGGIDFRPIFKLLRENDFQGWVVVEAEQNPASADPFLYARLAREYIRLEAGW